MSLEFELPLVSLIFVTMLIVTYFSKEKIQLPENKMYEKILIYTMIETIINTGIHFLCAMNDFSVINTTYYQLLNFLNKILSTLFVGIFISLLNYILIITYPKVKNNMDKVKICAYVSEIILFILTLFTNINLVKVGNVTNVTGTTIYLGYIVVAITLVLSLITALIKRKKSDRRYYALYFIILILGILYTTTIMFPGMIIYDVVLTILCYIMYFTIENPDVKMIEQLEVARDQADKANKAKTDFLSSMSHEIRTPLNAIKGFSDCITNSVTLDEAKENAKDIINASDTLLEIVNGILDISKIEAGKLEIINSPYNARSTFEELAKLIKPKMQEKGLDFSYYIAPDLPTTLYGDHTNIKKVVTNLLSNAAKYTEKGFVRYEVNCINTNDISKLIISVEDSGRGIKKENVDKLFTKFQRLDEDKNTTIEGTGLGLAITKQLTELMGGKIIVHTVYGEGSKFTVVLNQRIESAPAQKEEKQLPTTLDLKGVKILIVDDNTLNLKVATKLLERYNADLIICSESGFDCLDRINSGEEYDVILMDDMMPKMSGVETLKKLKENPNFKTPVIALTANAITGMKEKYLSEGFDEYLAKPIEKEDLIKVMNSILSSTSSAENPKIKEEHSVEFLEPEKIEETPLKEDLSLDITSEEAPTEKEQESPNKDKSLFSFLKLEKENKPTEEVISVENNNEEITENTEKTSMTEELNQNEFVSDKEKFETQEVNKYDEKEKFLHKKGVDLDKALELLGDMDMYEMTLKDFSDNADTKWLKIMSYKNTDNLADYAIEVHSLKSDCKYLGFMRLAERAYEHELKSKENDVTFVNNHFQELETEYNKVIEIIDEYNNLNKDKFTVMDLPQ